MVDHKKALQSKERIWWLQWKSSTSANSGIATWISLRQGFSSKGILAFPPVGDEDACARGQMA